MLFRSLRPSLATGDLVRGVLGPAGGEDACPAVVDAEALRTLAAEDGWWEGVRRPSILTPHAGEFTRLRAASGISPGVDGELNEDDEARCEAALDAAATWGHVVVLKGAHTVIAAPDGSAAIAPFQNPGLATGGSGDVLAGTIGALLAQGLAPYAAARLGVHLHGMAGEAARARLGDAGILAGDLPLEVALARRRLALEAERRASGSRVGFGGGGGAAPGADAT